MAATDYYTPSGTPGTGAFAASAAMRTEFDSISDGFALLPDLSAGAASRAVVVASNGLSLTTTTGTLALAGNFATTGAFATTLVAGADVSITLPTVTGLTLATLTGTETLTNKTISGASNTLSNIGNASLTNSSITINGSSVSLGGSVTVTAAASTLTGTTLASNVVASSLTSVGTLTSLTISGALTYGGVAFAATTTGSAGSSLVGSISPTFTGTLTAATISASGSISATSSITGGSLATGGTLTYGGVTLTAAVRGTGAMVLDQSPSITTPAFTGATTGTWTVGGTVTINAFTLAGTISGGGQNLNNIIIGASTPLAGTFTTLVATTINGNTFTTGTGVLTIGTAKTLTISNTLALAGTDGTTMTFPGGNDTVMGTTASQTVSNKSFVSFNLIGSSSGYTTFQSANASATNYALTFPAITDTVVALTATQTLTNKTLTAPTLTTPALGTPASGVLTNCSGFPGATSGNATTFLGANVTVNNTANFFSGPNTGSIGASGQVWKISAVACLLDSAGAATWEAAIFDGSAYVADVTFTQPAAGCTIVIPVEKVISLSGATTFTLRAKDASSTNGLILTSGAATGVANTASSITAVRIA